MSITGILPLRNGVKLEYPFELAIRSLQRVCDDVIVSVDPTSEDETFERVCALGTQVFESTWDTNNRNRKDGKSGEIARQTALLCEQVQSDWILSLQADEVLHENDTDTIRNAVLSGFATGFALERLYFYGSLSTYRNNWTVPVLRLFKKGSWGPDYMSGAMTFVPMTEDDQCEQLTVRIFHYSRIGDPVTVARRVRNLDTFYHDPANVIDVADVPAYDYSGLRQLDTYVKGTVPEADVVADLVEFPVEAHPADVLTWALRHNWSF